MPRQTQAALSTQNARNNSTQVTTTLSGIVLDVVYNESHPKVTEITTELPEGVDKRRVDYLYYAQIRRKDDVSNAVNDGQWYPPHSYTDLDLPVRGETVTLQEVEGRLCYKRIASFDLNLGNFDPNALIANNPVLGTKEENKAQKYAEVASTGTPVSSVAGSDEGQKQNDFIQPQQINPLRVFEGDKIIQSRFGQSIRFSGHFDGTQDFSPTIIIRNRQGNQQTNDLDEKTPTTENFQDDGSIIALSSNEQKLPYTQDFLVSQINAFGAGYSAQGEFTENTYPSEFIGDNLLIKSDRIILSAQTNEMIFLSKGNYGFISDGLFSIDNVGAEGKGGALLDFGGDVVVKSNGNDIKLLGDDGGLIYVNTLNQDEPIVKGNTLLDLLTELINLINQQVFSTPAGPTALGPNNRTDFESLRDRLDAFLSEKNFTE